MTMPGYRPLRVLLAAGLLLGVSGCTAYTLSSMQDQFKDLETTREACRSSDISGGAASICLAGSDAPLLDLATKTRDAAPQADDPRTRIGFLALASMAGWQSRTEAGFKLAEDVAEEGKARCDALDKSQFGVPRDCALLELAVPFVRHGRALNFLAAIEHAEKPLPPAQQSELVSQSQTYVTNTWDVIEGIRARLEADPEISKSVVAYLDAQRKILYCTAMKISERDQNFDDPATSQAVTAEVRAKMNPKFDDNPPVCGTGIPDPI